MKYVLEVQLTQKLKQGHCHFMAASTKLGTQSGLFTDCFTDSITCLKFDNRTDPLDHLGQAGAPQTDTSVLLSNYKLVMLSVNNLQIDQIVFQI